MIITGYFGEHYDRVDVDGRPLDPRPSQAVYNHSPDGFAWGYSGSGPAQLALAILLAVGVDRFRATLLYQAFKSEFVARLPMDADFVLELDVVGWVDAMLPKSAVDAARAEDRL